MRKASRALLYAALALFAAYYLVPLAIVLMTSFKTDAELRTGTLLSLPVVWTADPWVRAWSDACIGVSCTGLKGYYWNSLRIVVPAVAISTLWGALNGYALSLWRFRGSHLVFGFMTLGCFVPFQLVILPVARLLGWIGLAGTLTALIAVHVIYGLAFTTLYFRNFYSTIPKELIRAGIMDGAGFFTIFWRIILPLSPPIMIATVISQFTGVWNDFLIGAIFSTGATQPVTVALNNLINTTTGVKHYNVDMAAALIAGLPTLLVYFVAGKYFLRGLTAGAVKG